MSLSDTLVLISAASCLSFFAFAGAVRLHTKRPLKDSKVVKVAAAAQMLLGVGFLAYIVVIGDPAGGELPITSPIALMFLTLLSSGFLWFAKHLEIGILIFAEIALALLTVTGIASLDGTDLTKLVGFLGAILVITKALDELNIRLDGLLTNWINAPVKTKVKSA